MNSTRLSAIRLTLRLGLVLLSLAWLFLSAVTVLPAHEPALQRTMALIAVAWALCLVGCVSTFRK